MMSGFIEGGVEDIMWRYHPHLQYKSQVEGTIRNVQRQIETIKQFIKDKGL
jgi:hypothetical protein